MNVLSCSIKSEVNEIKQSNCFSWSQLEYLWRAGVQAPYLPASEMSHHPHLICTYVCIKRPIVDVGFSTFLPMCYCFICFYGTCYLPHLTASSAAFFSSRSVLCGFLRPQETNCPICLFLLTFGVEMEGLNHTVLQTRVQPWG